MSFSRIWNISKIAAARSCQLDVGKCANLVETLTFFNLIVSMVEVSKQNWNVAPMMHYLYTISRDLQDSSGNSYRKENLDL